MAKSKADLNRGVPETIVRRDLEDLFAELLEGMHEKIRNETLAHRVRISELEDEIKDRDALIDTLKIEIAARKGAA